MRPLTMPAARHTPRPRAAARSLLLALLALLALAPAARAQALQTAHNIWYERPDQVDAINYQRGALLPAGTKVVDVEAVDGRRPTLSFTVPDTGLRIVVHVNRRYYPGLGIADVKKRMLTTKTLDELTSGFTAEEKAAIQSGTVFAGMSKAAVLVSYGYPPPHRTPSLDDSTWTYWKQRFVEQRLVFDQGGRLLLAPGVAPAPGDAAEPASGNASPPPKPAQAEPVAKLSVAVWPLRGIADVDDDALQALTETVRVPVQNHASYDLLAADVMAARAAGKLDAVAACDSAQCAAEIGAVLAVQRMVVGNVAKLGTTYQVVLKLVDVERREILRSATERVDGSDAGKLFAAAEACANKLLE